jgi:hypothetical protein|tara:strand:- start:28 stop:321 length:294 start_codon:yes stop_codon:yes gene_type:complete
MILTIILLSVGIVVLGFTTVNLLKKNENQEDILASYLLYLDRISRVIELSDERLKKVDAKGSFESDDEIGFFFKEVKEIQEVLNEFQVKEIQDKNNG